MYRHQEIQVLILGLVFAASAATVYPFQEAPPARLWVYLHDESGNPVTARVYLRAPDGRLLVPDGSIKRGRREEFFHARGRFQIALPPARYRIEAIKGFEYYPVETEVDLDYIELQNRTTVATIVLKRMIDMPALGWYSGDVDMHPNHRDGGLYMTLEDSLLVAAGEDVRVANLLSSNRQGTTRVYDDEFFRDGEVDPVSSDESLLVVQQEFRNTSGMYGHMPLLGIKKLIQPFYTGLRPNWEDYPPNYTIAKRVQEQGGVVSYAHPAREEGIPEGLHVAREFPKFIKTLTPFVAE